jgi:ankyrin repeat protein
MLARIPVMCNNGVHYISVWEPGDEITCGTEHAIYAANGNIICYEDHDADLELTITDLTGIKSSCMGWMDTINENLISGVTAKDLTIIEFCVVAGADINYCRCDPLLFAIYAKEYRVVKFLLDHGASATGDTHLGNLLLIDRDPLAKAASIGATKIVTLLIKHGADPHIGDDVALVSAAQNGYTSTVKLLIKYKPSYEAVGKAYTLALTYNRVKVFNYLCEYLDKMRRKP